MGSVYRGVFFIAAFSRPASKTPIAGIVPAVSYIIFVADINVIKVNNMEKTFHYLQCLSLYALVEGSCGVI
jgi:hypothetical protein